MAIYARVGERIVTDDGRYLGTIARDLDGAERSWSADTFVDMQVDLSRASQRLPVTSWLLRKMELSRNG